jgi:hypothetical protein
MRRVVGRGARRRGLVLVVACALMVPGAAAAAVGPAAAGTLSTATAAPSAAIANLGAEVAVRRYLTPNRKITRVVLVGDSLAQEVAPFVQYLTAPKVLVPKFWGGTAACDWGSVDLQANRGTVVVISFTGNSLTPCMADGAGGFMRHEALVEQYRYDIGQLIDRSRRAGARVLLVGQPVRAPEFDADLEVAGINAAYSDYARLMSYVSYVDAGAAVEAPDGTFADRLPCTELDAECGEDGLTVVRGDGVHFCPVLDQNPCPVWSGGAFRFGLAIASAANRPQVYD